MTEMRNSVTAISSSAPSVACLFGEALGSWTRDQRVFWTIAGGLAIALGCLQHAIDANWLGGGGSVVWAAVITAGLYAFALHFLLRSILIGSAANDVVTYAPVRWPWLWATWSLAVQFVAIMSLIAVGLATRPQHTEVTLMLAAAAQWPIMAALAVILSQYLLYLPAESSGAPMTFKQASVAGKPIRGVLIRFALFCFVLVLLPNICATAVRHVTAATWEGTALRALVSLIDAFVLYVMAHGLASLFKRWTQCALQPMPDVA